MFMIYIYNYDCCNPANPATIAANPAIIAVTVAFVVVVVVVVIAVTAAVSFSPAFCYSKAVFVTGATAGFWAR